MQATSATDEKEIFIALLSIIEKLAHANDQVRSRALQNLMLKLNTGILTSAHLELHCKSLVPVLLNWFNFDTCPMCTEVLNLLLHLSRVSLQAVFVFFFLLIFHSYRKVAVF